MQYENLKKRTKQFALDIIKFVEDQRPDPTGRILCNQLLRAGTSVGANYRAACRSKSSADFISKMGTVEEEADECGYWLELLMDSGRVKNSNASLLLKEAGELTATTIASINTARKSGGRK
jgi:four helix bundle protein